MGAGGGEPTGTVPWGGDGRVQGSCLRRGAEGPICTPSRGLLTPRAQLWVLGVHQGTEGTPALPSPQVRGFRPKE